METKDKLSFAIRKFHSLTGLLCLGLFLFFHGMINSSIIIGSDVSFFNLLAISLQYIPYIIIIEVILAMLILFHGIFGTIYFFQARNNIIQYKYWRNTRFMLQRYTGVIVFIFLIFHIYTMKYGVYTLDVAPGEKSMFYIIGDWLRTWYGVAIYAVGIIVTVFHFANGVWDFLLLGE